MQLHKSTIIVLPVHEVELWVSFLGVPYLFFSSDGDPGAGPVVFPESGSGTMTSRDIHRIFWLSIYILRHRVGQKTMTTKYETNEHAYSNF